MALITYLSRIQFDFGAVRLVGEELAALGVRRPLVATDKGVLAAGLVDRVLAVVPAARVFDGTPENPTEDAHPYDVEADVIRRLAPVHCRGAAVPLRADPRPRAGGG